jgi:hypothetical protein
MESPRHKINTTYVGGRTLLSMLGNENYFVVMNTSGVRKNIFELLKVTVAKECDSVFPYGVMVRLGGDQDK